MLGGKRRGEGVTHQGKGMGVKSWKGGVRSGKSKDWGLM